jgi:hypothetical protein
MTDAAMTPAGAGADAGHFQPDPRADRTKPPANLEPVTRVSWRLHGAQFAVTMESEGPEVLVLGTAPGSSWDEHHLQLTLPANDLLQAPLNCPVFTMEHCAKAERACHEALHEGGSLEVKTITRLVTYGHANRGRYSELSGHVITTGKGFGRGLVTSNATSSAPAV